MRLMTILVLALAALWGGWWFVGANAEHRAVATGFANARARGYDANYSALSVVGFPNRFDLTISDPVLGDPATGTTWRAPFAQVLGLSYNPYHFVAALPHSQTLTTPDGSLTLTSQRIEGSLTLSPGLAFTLNQIVLIADHPDLASDKGWSIAADQVRFATRAMPDLRNAHELGLEVANLTLDPAARALIDPDAALPASIAEIHLDAAASFDAPLDRHAASVHPHLIGLTVKDAHLSWGTALLSAKGTITVDAEGTPEGRLDLTAKNWRPLVKVAAALGLIRPEIAPTWENMLNALAQGSGDPATVDIPLEINKGWMSLGPLPLGPAPKLR